MKKIVHIVDTLCVGGRENVVIDICNNLDKRKFKVFIICLCNDDNEAASRLNSDIEVILLPYSFKTRGQRVLFVMSYLMVKNKLTKILKNIDPDIIHTHSFVHRLLIISLAVRLFSKKSVFYHTVHTSGLYFEKSGLVNFFKLSVEKLALSLYNPSLVAISEIVQRNNIYFYKKYTKRTRYIPNGINLNHFNRNNIQVLRSDWKATNDDIIMTYVSRLSPGKNHITLLKSMIMLISINNNIKLYLAGDGELRNDLQVFVNQNSLQKNVQFLGAIDNVNELLSITDIGVFPSEFEGFGLSLIEMMAMELPVVVSDNEIFKKFITHEENGLIFSMHDHKSLFDNILKLIENEELANLIKKNAKKFSKQFSIENMILGHEHYYSN